MGVSGWLGAGTLLLAAGMGQAGPIQAQEESEPHIGCFRGRPLPTCKSFWIFEMQGALPLAQTHRLMSYGEGYAPDAAEVFSTEVEWNLGHMVNLDRTWALGGEITVGSGNSDPLTGVRARARRWIGPDVSLEVEGGLLRSDAAQATSASVAGPTAGLRLNIRDQGAFFVRWDALSLPEESNARGYFGEGGWQQAVSLGVSAGSVPAVVTTGALGLTIVVLAGLLWGSD